MEKLDVRKKPKEDFEISSKKTVFDRSYRFKLFWWPAYWVFIGLCAFYAIFLIIVFVGTMVKWSDNTNQGLGLGCGFSLILVFALFWITNNLINAKMFLQPDFSQEVKDQVKKQMIWSNVFRICAAFLTLACGLICITAGFMNDADDVSRSTIKILNGVNCLLFIGLAATCIVAYTITINTKLRVLDTLVPSKPTIQSAEK